jgi:hypothetical protein
MPRYIIESDDEAEHRSYLNGPRAFAALWGLAEELRSRSKHATDGPASWQEVRDLFYGHCGDILHEQGE